MEYIGYLASILIGVTLGLIGGGGSILTLPILVFLFEVNPEQATSYSLFIVGITALVGTAQHYKMGNLQLKSALFFAFPSVLSLLFVREMILPKIPALLFTIGTFSITKSILIMVIFAMLMIIASFSMIKKTNENNSAINTNYFRLSIIGLLVGLVTGFLGAGGGFLIIPALIFFGGLPMKQAVGTSLLIIFINSAIGFSGDLLKGVTLNYQLLSTITAIAIVGMFIGTTISKKINGEKLKPAFGWFILIMGVYIISKEIFFQ